MVLIQWFIFYIVPAIAAFFFKGRETGGSWIKRTISIHLFVLLSIVLLSLSGANIIWNFSETALAFLLFSILLSFLLIGRLGFIYTISSFIQEWSILLAGSFLASDINLFFAAILTSMPFSFAHDVNKEEWYWKPTILLFWGVFSIYLYISLEQPLVNIGLHIILGSALIKGNFLYKTRQTNIKI